MVNNAVYDNPPSANGRTADIHITQDGSNYYYAYCAFSGFMAILILVLSRFKRRTDRIFFYLCATINITMSISYYAMGSNLGMTPISVEFQRGTPRVRGDLREIFWVRYVQWFINTPLILSILLLPTAVPAPKFLFTIFLNQTMIIMGLVGAVTSTTYKWGFFAFGCAALFYLLGTLLLTSRRFSRRHNKLVQHQHHDTLNTTATTTTKKPSSITKLSLLLTIYQLILWICYPICWGVSEGGNIIAPDSEAVYYGILDILAVPFFSILVLVMMRKVDLGALGLRGRDYDDEVGGFGTGRARGEKGGMVGPMLGPERRRSSSSLRGDLGSGHTHGTGANGGVVDAGSGTGNAGERVV